MSAPVKLATAADLIKLLPSIVWEWFGWLARGFVTVIVGEPGLGKSQVGLRIVDSFITGKDWPDGQPGPRSSRKVIWCDTEASQAILSERIQKWKLPQDSICMPGADPLASFDLSLAQARQELREMVILHKPAALIIDSLAGAHSGEEKSTREMQRILKFLAELARDTGIAVLVVAHARKKNLLDGTEFTLDRVRGAGVIGYYARMVIALDKVGSALKFFVVKSNLALKPKPLGMTITDSGVTFGDAPKRPPTLNDRIDSFLRDLLADGPKSYHEIEQAALLDSFSKRQLYASKDRIGAITLKRKWTLPMSKASTSGIGKVGISKNGKSGKSGK